jgi:transcriptional antiterminator
VGIPTPKLKKLKIAQRKQRLIELMREHVDWNQQDLAKELGVNRSTVAKDLKEINEELNMQTIDDWMVQRQRIILEIEENKRVCMERLKRLHGSPHQGARWMEEWSKLQEKIIRIYGVYSPEKMMIRHSQEFSKEQRDAAVDAAVGAVGQNPTVIDLKKITHNDGKSDADADPTAEHNQSAA